MSTLLPEAVISANSGHRLGFWDWVSGNASRAPLGSGTGPKAQIAPRGLLSTQNRIAAGRVAILASTLAQTVISSEIVDAATGPHVVVITGALTTVPVFCGIKWRYCGVFVCKNLEFDSDQKKQTRNREDGVAIIRDRGDVVGGSTSVSNDN